MKFRIATIVLFLLCLIKFNAYASDYTITIDGKEYDIDLDKQESIKITEGHSHQISLKKKLIVSFKNDNYTFNHSSNFSPTRTAVNKTVYQTLMASPVGSMVLIQEYNETDPSNLVDSVISSMTKNKVQGGYTITKSDITQELSDGTILTGKKAVLVYKSKITTYNCLYYKKNNAGLIIVSLLAQDPKKEDTEMVELFWKTLKISWKAD